jgi:hypothetical protein
MQVEKERNKFSEKLESIKSQLKKDYERLLRVSTKIIVFFILSIVSKSNTK